MTDQNILEVQNLKTYFMTRRGAVKAVNGINFNLHQGECLCLVGESGCGKSVTALSILRLFESPPGQIVQGSVNYFGKDLVKLPLIELRKIRGKDIAMVFQDAQSALNPVFTIGDQIIEQLGMHTLVDKADARNKALDLLKSMGIPDAERAFTSYPHQLSGGMRQRAMIAMSLSCGPQVLIADEPTTAVDVTIKAQILDLFQELKARTQMSILFITHDFGVVAQIGERAVIVYAGENIETGTVSEIISHAAHPYTVSLLSCLPDLKYSGSLYYIPGSPPNPLSLPDGCTFHPRCEHVMSICREQKPVAVEVSPGHYVSCHLFRKA
jgi:peptide/nickel transport system ATP-binding protein